MIGVGKLGQDCAEVMHDAGYDVVGYDVVPRQPTFTMCDSIQDAVSSRDIIFIAAPTPHDPIYGGETPSSHLPNKDFDYTIVTEILKEVNRHVNRSQLVVLISTVLPGTVRNLLEPCITNARFIYNPYLIAMGTVKWDMVNPEMVIIGTEDGSLTGDASELVDFYKVFMKNNPRYEVGTWDEAESIKIFYNTFISTKLALVNMVQDVAETNGNINVDVVTNALAKSTHRIMGPAYMKAGLGDAGACHPRDNIALRYLADRLDLGYDLFDSIMTAREVQAERMALRCLKNGRNITIIGKAYKPGVPYLNGSASMLVGHYVEKHGGNLNYYDLNTNDTDLKQDWTDVYLIGYWEEYVEDITFNNPAAVVIDPWRKITTKQHTGEIIHYGDTRRRHDYVPPETTIKTITRDTIDIWPELKDNNEVHIIDAMITSETTFLLRPTEIIVQDILSAKKNGKNKFLFYSLTEAFMPYIVNKIHRISSLINPLIKAEDLYYLTSAVDGAKVYDQFTKNNSISKINVVSARHCQYRINTFAKIFKDDIPEYNVKLKQKKFLCFNKLERQHRIDLIEKMFEFNLVDQGFYSFHGEDEWVTNNSDTIKRYYPNIHANIHRFPLRLNITDDRPNPVDIRLDDLIFHEESYFSIVTETMFYDNTRPNYIFQRPPYENSMFFTEKTYRCCLLKHPFLIFGRPYVLQSLRNEGYRTFSNVINESYDTIEDDDLRFSMLFNEIQRLLSFTDDQWLEWQHNVSDIVEHNFNTLLNQTKFNVTSFNF